MISFTGAEGSTAVRSKPGPLNKSEHILLEVTKAVKREAKEEECENAG